MTILINSNRTSVSINVIYNWFFNSENVISKTYSTNNKQKKTKEFKQTPKP